MDIQKLLSDAHARADINGDGKLSPQDLDALRDTYGIDSSVVNDLRAKADANGDGKLDFEDLKSGLGDLGSFTDTLKDQIFGGKQ
ncbi:hypothetical protein EOL96_04895 [Candidatus Saccharibacteria bacterium]|nr:hypothetical protein [Candidatus Saccharibacteria bacterium]